MATSPIPPTRSCTRCSATGKLSLFEGHSTTCYYCKGSGVFAAPDIPALLAAIRGRKGLVSRRPADSRAYYVWRMARFHGGVDVTLPICASGAVRGDPFLKELDALADAVAKRVYGTDLAAAYRWSGLLTSEVVRPDGLPPTAYPSGPVVTGPKPACELAELFGEDEIAERAADAGTTVEEFVAAQSDENAA